MPGELRWVFAGPICRRRSSCRARRRSGRAWLPEPTTKVGPERRAGYGADHPLEEVLAPGYFGAAGTLLQPGDLVYVRARASGESPGVGSSRRGPHGAPDGPARPARPRRRPPGAGLRPARRARRGRPDGDRFAGGGDGGAPVAQARPRPAARQPDQEKRPADDDVGELKRQVSEIRMSARDSGPERAPGSGDGQGISGHFPIFRQFSGRRIEFANADEGTPMRHFCTIMRQKCSMP